MAKASRLETEIKLRVTSAAEARRRLKQAGFLLLHRRALESNQIYDTPDSAFRRSGRLVRLRTWGSRAVLTFKGPARAGARHKSREEIEIRIGDARDMALLLERIGFVKTFRYDKYRSEFHIAGENGRAALDETPIGVFLELEGSPRWIDRSARKLGFGAGDYITASYGSLYTEETRRKGGPREGMVLGPSGDCRRPRVSTSKKST